MKSFLLVLTLFISLGSYACECNSRIQRSVEHFYKTSKIIFTGKVVALKLSEKTLDEGRWTHYYQDVEIEITEVFRGDTATKTITIINENFSDCGTVFQIDTEYLFFPTWSIQQDRFMVHYCHKDTLEVIEEDAEWDISELRDLIEEDLDY